MTQWTLRASSHWIPIYIGMTERNAARFAFWTYLRLCDGDGLFLDHRHHVFFTHHQQLFTVDLHFGAAVLAEQDVVADLHIEGAHFAALEDLALAHGNDLAFDRLFGGGVGNDDAAGTGALLFQALDDHAIVQWTNL